MWGALTKNAQALASIAAEQAQKGLASANQLLEKLDGQLEGEEGDGEDDENDDINSEDGSRNEVIKDTKSNKELSSSNSGDADTNHHQAIKNTEAYLDNVRDGEESLIIKERNQQAEGKETTTKCSQFAISPDDELHGGDNSVDDELDQLLLDDESVVEELPADTHNEVVLSGISSYVYGAQPDLILESGGSGGENRTQVVASNNLPVLKGTEQYASDEVPVIK